MGKSVYLEVEDELNGICCDLDDSLFEEDSDEEEQFYDIKEDNGVVYKLLSPSSLSEDEEPLSKVVGLENQKKELRLVLDWFKHSKELRQRGVSIPKGVLLYGEPGNGKTLLIKEIIKCADAPVFVFQGEQRNIAEGIVNTFKKAKEIGHAIIVLDELDLLISQEDRVVRVLQENLDGVESADDVLVLAATNSLRKIPYALRRNGRIDKLISVPYPTAKEALELLKRYFNDFNVELPADFDEDIALLTLSGLSCTDIKAVVNDVVLRNGFENITTTMIDSAVYQITGRVIDSDEEGNMRIAIHESSHAVIANLFKEHFRVNRLKMNNSSGCCSAVEVEQNVWTYDKSICDIKIAMAGVIGEKVVYGQASQGCLNDLQSARMKAYCLINLNGYSNCWETLPRVEEGRTETFIKRRHNERKIEALLRKCEKEVTKLVKKHKKEIVKLATLLFEKKNLKSSEILSVIG